MATRLIILAAGKGTRMKSRLPKVLHPLAGRPLLAHVLESADALAPASITVVIGHGADQIRSALNGATTAPLHWAVQQEQLGTAHAAGQGLSDISADDTVLIAYGDTPLTRVATYQALIDSVRDDAIGLLTVRADDPSGYGRILRNAEGSVVGIVEHKDASAAERDICEINSGVLAVRGELLLTLLPRIGNQNSQGEYYLTDLFALAVAEGVEIATVQPEDAWEVDGVNSRHQLETLERVYQRLRAEELMASGVTLADAARLDIRGTLTVESDVFIDVGCVFSGTCHLETGVSIGPGCVISDSHLGAGCTIQPYSVIENARMGADCRIGPFARIRPGTELGSEVRIGNFVEIKNAEVERGSKVNHLSYIGDAEVGQRVNVGAGTITANYDGVNKHRTVLEDDVSIGSNVVLVAPVTVEQGATVGAGSTISERVAGGSLSLTRAKRRDIPQWPRPIKQ